jgi:signal transduction histidine kinase
MSRTARSRQAPKATLRGPKRGKSAHVTRARKTAPAQKPNPSDVPSWAAQGVFRHVRTAAWEGSASPLRLGRIIPESGSFVSSLPLAGTRDQDWTEIIHPIDKQRVETFFGSVASRQHPSQIEYRIIDIHGSVVWVRHSIDEVVSSGSEGASVRGFVTDIQTEKDYQAESLRVSEREQNRIGQDLHDDLCQILAGVSCLMRVFEGRIATKAPEELESLKELNQQIIDAMHRTRALTHGLFPGKIQIADIRGALLELASQIKTRFKVAITTQFAGRFPKHSSAQIIQIYRISQEAMSNAIKHGRATEIAVRLEARQNGMELTITDNGCGFPKGETAAPGVGLSIMKYRANMLGGEVSVVDNNGCGVSVRLRYPFESQ